MSFANSSGGILLIGVDDDGSILGVKDPIEEQFSIDQALSNHCSSPLDIESRLVQISRSRSVMALHVRENKLRPVFVLEDGGKRQTATIRVGDKAIDASREMRRIMKHQSSPQDVSFIFGEKEELLMKHLSTNEGITVVEFADLCSVPIKLASHTLVLLTKADVLKIVPRDKGGDVFILANGSE